MLFGLCVVFAVAARVLPEAVRDPIANGLRQTVVAPLVHLQASAERTRSSWLNYERLSVSRDSIALRAMQVQALESENERLRKMLGLGARLEWGFVPAEALHGQSIGEETTVALSAGSDAGVRRYAPVLAPEGLVGTVQTVDPGTSVALLWGHPQFRPSAMSADGSAFGIIHPHASEGAEGFLLELRGVQFRSPLDTGSLVVTSGLGGVFPAGIPIGTVVGEIKTTELWARTYLLRPAVPPPDVRSVMILSQQRTAAGVQKVWTPQRTDSAARAIARAGDSLARRDQALAAAARVARGDTVRPVAPSGARGGAPAAATRPATTQPAAPRSTPPARAVTDTTATRPVSAPPVAAPPPVRPDSVVTPPPVPPPLTPPPVTLSTTEPARGHSLRPGAVVMMRV